MAHLQKDLDKSSERYSALFKDFKAQCTAKYFSGDRNVVKQPVSDIQEQTPDGAVQAGETHPLRAFVAAPRLPDELAAFLHSQQ